MCAEHRFPNVALDTDTGKCYELHGFFLDESNPGQDLLFQYLQHRCEGFHARLVVGPQPHGQVADTHRLETPNPIGDLVD